MSLMSSEETGTVLNWKMPAELNGPLDGFMVFVKELSNTIKETNHTLNATQLSITFAPDMLDRAKS